MEKPAANLAEVKNDNLNSENQKEKEPTTTQEFIEQNFGNEVFFIEDLMNLEEEKRRVLYSNFLHLKNPHPTK